MLDCQQPDPNAPITSKVPGDRWINGASCAERVEVVRAKQDAQEGASPWLTRKVSLS